MSGVPVVTDVGETAPSVVTVMCEGVRFRLCGKPGRHELRRNACEGSSVPRNKDEDAAAAAELFVDNGERKLVECSRKNGYCKDGTVCEQQ